MSSISQIISKVNLWKEVHASRFNTFQDYLFISFTDKDSISVNDQESIETAKYVIYFIKFKEPYTASSGRIWQNDRFKVFYFIRHEYGDFYEMDYIPMNDGWKLRIYITLRHYQAILDSWRIENITPSTKPIDVDILRDFNKNISNTSFEVDIEQIKSTLGNCIKSISTVKSDEQV